MKITLFFFASILLFIPQKMQADSIPRDTTFNTKQAGAKIHAKYPNTSIAEPILPAGVVAIRDLVYLTLENTPYGTRNLHLDIFRPEKSGKYPVLLMIHGGGWSSGNKTMEIPMAQQIAAAGYITIPVEYRLTPEAKYPAAVLDIKAAVRWVRANAEKYGMDTSRIAIEGNSAGGLLATLIGMTNNVALFEGSVGNPDQSSKVHAVINVDGMVDFLAPTHLNNYMQKNYPIHPWLGVSFRDQPTIWREASPAYWVTNKAVPVLFINSSVSRFHAGQSEMIDIMNTYSIYSEVKNIPDCPHAFWLVHPWFDLTVNYTVEFLDKIF